MPTRLAARDFTFDAATVGRSARAAASAEHGAEAMPEERVLERLPRHFVLTGPTVASELAIPLKTASAALRDLVEERDGGDGRGRQGAANDRTDEGPQGEGEQRVGDGREELSRPTRRHTGDVGPTSP